MKSKQKIIKKDINKTKVVHENSKCSKCGQSPIEGIRYYCLKCETFELCSACEKNYGEKHGHELLKIRRPEDFNKFKIEIIKQKELQNLNKIEENEEKKVDLTKCHSKCMNLKKIYTTLNNNNFLPIEIIIKNTGDEQWPTPCFFTCDESSEVKGDRVKLVKCTGKPEEEYKLKFKIILKDINKTGIYKSIWQLKNENDEVFGEKIEIVIKDIFEKDKKLRGGKKDKKNIVKDYRDELEENVKEIKQKYDILFSTSSIRNALIRTKGNKENAIKMLYTEKNRNSYYQKY
jgi:ribosomal protein S27AE